MSAVLWLVILLLLAARAWLGLGQAALPEVAEAAVRRQAATGDCRAEAVLRLLVGSEPRALLAWLDHAAVLLIAALILLAQPPAGYPPLPGWPLPLLVAVALLVLSGLVARTYGRLFAERVAYSQAPALSRLVQALRPLSRALGRALALVCGETTEASPRAARLVTAADIQIAADLGEESGQVEPEVGKMLDEVMALSSTTVREIMTPRVEIVGVPAEASAADLMEVAIESGFSRLPVFEGDLDSILGIVLVSDLLARLSSAGRDFRARDLARPALLTPETRRVSEMLREMRERATHMAIVVDESGGTAGLVTIEDILEELVGEIRDEHDTSEDTLIQVSSDQWLVEGRTRLEELEEAVGLPLPPAEADTVAGLFAWLLGRIPESRETISYGGLRFTVEEEEAQYAKQVRVTRLPPEED